MNRSGLIRLCMVVTLLASCTLARAVERSVYKRLSSTHYEYYSSLDDAGGASDVQYYYTSPNSMLLGSVTYHAVSDLEGETNLAYNFQSSITNTPSGRQVDYFATPIGDGISAFSLMYVLDSQNRVLHSRHIDYGASPEDTVSVSEIFRRYNAYGYADSIYSVSRTGNETFESCSVSSFNNSMLSATTLFYKNNGAWKPSWRYTFSYPSNPTVLPEFIRWDNLSNQILFESISSYASAYNPKVIPSEIVFEVRDNGVWTEINGERMFQTLVDGVVLMRFSSQLLSGSGSYRANQSGDIIGYSDGWSYGMDHGSRTYAINWESVVLNDEEEVIAIDPLPRAYPNPFKESTMIRLENSSKFGSKVSIYNLRGQLVRQWDNVWGNEVFWDGKDGRSMAVPSGVYLIKYEADEKVRSVKVMRY